MGREDFLDSRQWPFAGDSKTTKGRSYRKHLSSAELRARYRGAQRCSPHFTDGKRHALGAHGRPRPPESQSSALTRRIHCHPIQLLPAAHFWLQRIWAFLAINKKAHLHSSLILPPTTSSPWSNDQESLTETGDMLRGPSRQNKPDSIIIPPLAAFSHCTDLASQPTAPNSTEQSMQDCKSTRASWPVSPFEQFILSCKLFGAGTVSHHVFVHRPDHCRGY